jgi:hypothetical protein
VKSNKGYKLTAIQVKPRHPITENSWTEQILGALITKMAVGEVMDVFNCLSVVSTSLWMHIAKLL